MLLIIMFKPPHNTKFEYSCFSKFTSRILASDLHLPPLVFKYRLKLNLKYDFEKFLKF